MIDKCHPTCFCWNSPNLPEKLKGTGAWVNCISNSWYEFFQKENEKKKTSIFNKTPNQ